MTAALVGLVALVLAGCAPASSGDATASADPLTDAAAALCTARRDLDAGTAPQRLAGDLDQLLTATGAALTAISISPPTCTG